MFISKCLLKVNIQQIRKSYPNLQTFLSLSTFTPKKSILNKNYQRFEIIGLSEYSNKNDVINVFKNYEIHNDDIKFDQILDETFHKSGIWTIDVINQKVKEFKYHIDQYEKARRKQGIKIQQFTPRKSLILASDNNISNRTVLVHSLPNSINEDHILHLFESFPVSNEPIRMIPKHYSNFFFVNFESPRAAQVACINCHDLTIEGESFEVYWYDL